MPEIIDYFKLLCERGPKIALKELKSRLYRENPQVSLNRLLNLLKKYDIPYTFFIVGTTAENYPEVIDQILKMNHEIGAHGFLHKRMDQMNDKEIKMDLTKQITLFKTKFNYNLQGFRAPYLKTSLNLRKIIKELEFRYTSSYMVEDKFNDQTGIPEFSIIFDDWDLLIKKKKSPKEMFNIISENLNGINILLLHPFRIGQKGFIEHLEDFITHYKNEYSFVTLSNLLKKGIHLQQEKKNIKIKKVIALTGDIGELALLDLIKRALKIGNN